MLFLISHHTKAVLMMRELDAIIFLNFLLSDTQLTGGTPLGVIGAHRHAEELQGYFIFYNVCIP